METLPPNIFSVDVEAGSDTEAFTRCFGTGVRPAYPDPVEKNTGRLLELLSRHRVSATFFILGRLAELHPGLVRAIVSGGHEVASHGYGHGMLTRMSRQEFREDVRRSKRILEDLSGKPVLGYRAPTFSIIEDSAWAYGILAEEGFLYSSSVFPAWHDRYGWPGFGSAPRRMAADGCGRRVWEIPLSVADLGIIRFPFGGGGYLRHYPLALTKALMLRRMKSGLPAVVYVHPWEIDAAHPHVPFRFLQFWRHFGGVRGMERKIGELLRSFRFGNAAEYVLSLEREEGARDVSRS